MRNDHQDSAMTEISLALAMAFFSIMVLTLISMGSGEAPSRSSSNVSVAPLSKATHNRSSTVSTNEDQLVIFYKEKFYDKRLQPLGENSLDPNRRVILAIDPSLPLVEVVKIRSLFSSPDLIISTLDERWLKALGE